MITLGDILEILPFEDPIVVLELDGEAICAALDASLETCPAPEGSACPSFQSLLYRASYWYLGVSPSYLVSARPGIRAGPLDSESLASGFCKNHRVAAQVRRPLTVEPLLQECLGPPPPPCRTCCRLQSIAWVNLRLA